MRVALGGREKGGAYGDEQGVGGEGRRDGGQGRKHCTPGGRLGVTGRQVHTRDLERTLEKRSWSRRHEFNEDTRRRLIPARPPSPPPCLSRPAASGAASSLTGATNARGVKTHQTPPPPAGSSGFSIVAVECGGLLYVF